MRIATWACCAAVSGVCLSAYVAPAAEPRKERTVVTQRDAKSVVLHTVPWVGFYQGPKKGNPEDHPLTSIMRALMEYVGDDLGLPGFAEKRGSWRWSACALFHGITGAGFAFQWEQPYGEGHLGRKLIHSYERAFAIAGYDYRMLLRSAFAAGQDYAGPAGDDEAEFRRLIVQTIRDRRLPVVAIGVLGPDEPCLISGFRENGNVLVGWNFFQNEAREDPRLSFDDAGHFVLRDWFRDTRGIVVPGDRANPAPNRPKLICEALQLDLALLCNGFGTDDAAMGVATYQTWIDFLLTPVPEPAAGDPRRLEPLYKRHNDPIGELAERRAYASSFLSQAADALPRAAEGLRQASFCHQAMHDLLWRVWQTLGAWNRTDDAKLLRFAEPEFRLELAALVRRLQAWDAEAATHIRQALLELNVPETDLPTSPKLAPVEGLRDLGIQRPLPGRLGQPWEGGKTVISGVSAPVGAGLAQAVRAAAAATRWPIDEVCDDETNLQPWAATAGWQLNVVTVPPDAPRLQRVQLISDVVLSCLYGLPVATTHNGTPAVIVGYDHLASGTLRVCLPGQPHDQPVARVKIHDTGWGRTWGFLAGRRNTGSGHAHDETGAPR